MVLCMVGDPGIEPGVRLREGVTVPSSGASVPNRGASASIVRGIAAVIRCVQRNLWSICRCLRGLLTFCHP